MPITIKNKVFKKAFINTISNIKSIHEHSSIFFPNPKQTEVFNCDKKRIIVKGGRKAGKTSEEVFKTLEKRDYPGALTFVYTKTYPMLKDIWLREFEAQRRPRMTINYSDCIIKLPHGGQVVLRHGGNHDSAELSRGVSQATDFLFDEFAFLAPDLWDTVKFNLWSKDACAVFMSSPWVGHFHALWKYAEEAINDPNHLEHDLWATFHRTSYDGTPCYLTKEEWRNRIDREKGSMSAEMWRVEVEAEFPEESGNVFTKIGKAFARGRGEDPDHPTPKLAPFPSPDEPLVFGIDIGNDDRTTIVALDKNGNCWALLNTTDPIGEWEGITKKIVGVLKKYKIATPPWYDNTGIGNTFAVLLFQNEISLKQIAFNGRETGNRFNNKRTMVNNLQVAFELNEINIADNEFATEFKDQLLLYKKTLSKIGDNIEFNAPSGCHDDLVAALMLAWSCKIATLDKMGTGEPIDYKVPDRIDLAIFG